MTKAEFFAIGGTDQHLKDPNFDIVEFMTNFSEEDKFGIELLHTSPLIDESYLIYTEYQYIEVIPEFIEMDMEYGCQHKYDKAYDDGYYEAKKNMVFIAHHMSPLWIMNGNNYCGILTRFVTS